MRRGPAPPPARPAPPRRAGRAPAPPPPSAGPDRGRRRPPRGGPPAARRASTLTAYRWELTKLAALVRTRAMLAACLIAPPIVVLVLRSQTPPADTLFGRYIHASGFAVPLLLLGFASQWVFPL